jgi:5'-phosphate synthase pdxT subunit
MKICVIAFQGDVSEHLEAARRCFGEEHEIVEARRPGIVPACDGIILPGGESTTISSLLEESGIGREIAEAAKRCIPIMATCAGLVIVASRIKGDEKVRPLKLIDIEIDRNAFGSQRDSFEADLAVDGFEMPYHAIFIRAPSIGWAGPGVRVLSRIDDSIVAVRSGNLLAMAFHPELTCDLRFHDVFKKMVEERVDAIF